MRRHLTLILMLAALFSAQAQTVVADRFDSLVIHYVSPDLRIDALGLADAKYLTLEMEGYMPGGNIGHPATPTLTSIIAIPFCDDIAVRVSNAVYDTVDLPSLPLLPLQPGRSKSDTTAPRIHIASERYASDLFDRTPLANVEVLGIARDRRLARISFAPVRTNPVVHRAIVCRSADVTVLYQGADSAATLDHYRLYHTPAFNAAPTLNQLPDIHPAKGGSSISPTRMVIVAPTSLKCRRIDQFADWKRFSGFSVDVYYYNLHSIFSAEQIASYLTSLYSNATPDAPAPTYILLIGDREQTPAFSSRQAANTYYGVSNGHITDLYYTTWTSGDILPDGYIGRLSANDTITLSRIINKTILYESYSFDDDSYLARAALIAGPDQYTSSDYAYRYCDPTMDYAAYNYINSSSGYRNVYYYKNNTSFVPSGVKVSGSTHHASVDSALLQLYNRGLGWINYSGHGEWNCWARPLLNTTRAAQLQNVGHPAFVIANCCLSNKFDRDACLGEALLRRADNAGAVAYIGGSNSTYWDEDFYWAVGVRSNIHNTLAPLYNANHLGAYDRLFHTHYEPFASQANTAGSLVYYGNLSVNSTYGNSWSNVIVPYYWEIYTLMGDPSLMPWLGQAATMPFSTDTTSRPIRVTTAPNAYVALIDSASLQVRCAAYANNEGLAHLYLPDSVSVKSVLFAASAQGYQPYSEAIDRIRQGLSVAVSLFPNPSSTHSVTVDATNLNQIDIFSSAGHFLRSVRPDSDTYTLDLHDLQPGLYILLVQASDGPATKRLILQ